MSKGQGAGDGGRGEIDSPTPHAPRPSPQHLARRILIIGLSNVGDAILTSDVIAAVRRRYPDAHLTLVVGQRATALFADNPRIQTLVDFSMYDSLVGRMKLALALWRYQPHVVIDLRHTLYPFLLKPLSAWRYLRKPPKSIVHMRARHLWKLRTQAPEFAWSPTAKGRGPMAGSLPQAGELEESPMWWAARDAAHVEGLWKRWQLARAPRLVIICPGARSHIKRWTAEGFARVADRLITEARAQVVLSGEPDEEAIVDEIMGLMTHRAASAVGSTTIRQLGVLMRRAHLVITNDSASLHLASVLDVPTVAIFGPTDEQKYGPTSSRHRTLRRTLFCTPCERSLCRFNHECMRFISADEVFIAAKELLEGAGGGRRGAGETSLAAPHRFPLLLRRFPIPRPSPLAPRPSSPSGSWSSGSIVSGMSSSPRPCSMYSTAGFPTHSSP